MVDVKSPAGKSNGRNVERIRVWPATEAIRQSMRHPAGGIKFRETMDQSVEWPKDTFTNRRIAEGDVLTSK